MKRFLLFVIIGFVAVSLNAQQTTRTMVWDGVERQYIEFIPSTYSAEAPCPVIFCLHGLGDSMENFTSVGFNTLPGNWIVITPQALVATIPFIGDLGTAWNSGVGANLGFLGTIILNENVDDAGFLMAVLDSLENNFNINTDSVFFMGFSMGGFMSHKMAILHGDRINGIAAVSGTVGKYVTETPITNVNVLHFHGTADTTITYENAGFNTGIAGVQSVGKGAEATVEFWRSYNNCDIEPTHTYFPNTMQDGLEFERFLYENGNQGTRVAFIKVNEGQHSWYYSPVNDIDYTTEIYKFFTNTMDFPTSNSIIKSNAKMHLFPNPANNILYLESQEKINIEIFDVSGKLVMQTVVDSGNSNLNIENLPQGIYVVKANGATTNLSMQISIQR